MPLETFSYSPARGASQVVAPRVRTAMFGDGYQQRVADGINTQPRKWNLTFTRATADIDAIEAFLIARDAVDAFHWTPPSGVAGVWICKEWQRNALNPNGQTLTATFEETFGDTI